jgi:cyclopropane fatty-acyl-phospholipid synthase-like methyltransferase
MKTLRRAVIAHRGNQRLLPRAFSSELSTNYSPKTYERAVFYEPGAYQDWMVDRCKETWDLNRVETLLDAGCAGGLFTGMVAKAIGCPESGILALEPQEDLALGAERRGLATRRATLQDYLEADRPEQRFDAVLLKEVAHLLPEWPQTFGLLHQAIAPGGRLLVVCRPQRSSLPFFAAAHEAYAAITPSHLDLIEALRSAGFAVKWEEAAYTFEMPREKWLQSLQDRCWSNLQQFSDSELRAGIDELRAELAQGEIEARDVVIFITAGR